MKRESESIVYLRVKGHISDKIKSIHWVLLENIFNWKEYKMQIADERGL